MTIAKINNNKRAYTTNLLEANFGSRDERDHYKPFKRVGYPPIFIWPIQPVKGLKWILSIPGYFLPWNSLYIFIGIFSWYYLSPPLEDYSQVTVQQTFFCFAKNSLLVLVYFGIFHFHFYFKKSQGRIFKFNPNWPYKKNKTFLFSNQNIDNIIWTFGSGVTVWTLLEISILYLAANDVLSLIKIDERPIYFLFMIITIHLWRDIHFYFVHRAIHWGPLYRHAHYIHHKNNNPGPWSGLAMHPTEHFLYFSCALIYLFFPFHPLFVVITLTHAGLSPAPGHAGFERFVSGKKSFDIDAHAHYLHHKYFECNYADGIMPLDRWFGTFHDGSPEAQTELRKRLKEQSLKKG